MITIEYRNRFWSNTIEKSNGCIEWTASFDKKGYGQFRGPGKLKIKKMGSHRIAFILENGFVPESHQFVCHSCDNPKCVNPKHLWLGDNNLNRLDSISKGRSCNKINLYCIKGHFKTGRDKRGIYCKECQRKNQFDRYHRKNPNSIFYRKSNAGKS